MRHPCPWSCSCRHGPTAQSTSSGSWYSGARSSMCPCDPYLSPSTANQYTWFVRTTASLGSATVLKAGCISHFLPSLHLCGLCKKALPLHSPLTQWSQRLWWMSRSQIWQAHASPQPDLKALWTSKAWLPLCWRHVQFITGSVSAPAAPTGSSLTRIS